MLINPSAFVGPFKNLCTSD